MGDITIKIPISTIYKEVARRSSIATETDPYYAKMSTEKKQYSQLHGEGDRITEDYTREAAKEVLQAYLNRQGDLKEPGFEYNIAISAGESAVKQKETITMTGTEGSAFITAITPLAKKINFVDDLTTTNQNFVIDNADYYDTLGIVLTSLASALIFEAKIAGVPFTAPNVINDDGDLAGTTAHTTANVSSEQVTSGYIIYRVAENSNPLSVDQTNAIIERLTRNTKDAIIYYVLLSLYRNDGNTVKEQDVYAKAISLIDNLSGDLYRLHD